MRTKYFILAALLGAATVGAVASGAAFGQNTRFLMNPWFEINEQGRQVSSATTFIGDMIREEIVLEHPQRGTLLLTNLKMGKFKGADCARFDIICGETFIASGRAAVLFNFKGLNIIDVRLRFDTSDGPTLERHFFKCPTPSAIKEFFEKVTSWLTELVTKDIVPKLVATLILAAGALKFASRKRPPSSDSQGPPTSDSGNASELPPSADVASPVKLNGNN